MDTRMSYILHIIFIIIINHEEGRFEPTFHIVQRFDEWWMDPISILLSKRLIFRLSYGYLRICFWKVQSSLFMKLYF